MAKHVLLNNIEHNNLKIITRKSAEFGDNIRATVTFPTEFRDIQSEYPIFFQKDNETGEFQALAIMGFEEGQNLFLDANGWNASYIPAVIDRGPFLIGFQTRQENGETIKEPMIHVDMESPRISTSDAGEAVFLEFGGNSPYLEKVSRLLMVINEGIEASRAMFRVFSALDLIEPFSMDITFHGNEQRQVSGYYTINEDKLYALDANTLHQLNTSGYLFAAYMVVASMSNIRKLIDKRNLLLATQNR